MLIENVSSLPDENKYLNEARHFRSEKMLDFRNLISGKLWPAGKDLKRYRVAGRRAKASNVPKDGTYRYRALKSDCDACTLKPKCCPKVSMRKVPRSIYEPARDVARQLRGTPDYEFMRHERKKVEMSFAHLKAILKLDRLRLRGPCGVNDEFLLAATAQNLRKMAKLYINGRKMSTA